MKIYTIIGGVNGTGKSSLTGAIKAERSDLGIIIDVDKMAASLAGNNLEAGRAAVNKINDCIERGVSFTQETTLAGVRTKNTIQKAKDSGYHIRLYYIGLNTAEESLRRIRNRVEKGGHDIPQEDVLSRFKSRFESLAKILPYCDEATLFDNENGFVEVAEFRNGELITKGEHKPLWLVALIDMMERDGEDKK